MKILAYYNDLPRRVARGRSVTRRRGGANYAAERGHEKLYAALLRHSLARQARSGGEACAMAVLFAHGMDPNRPNWQHAAASLRVAWRHRQRRVLHRSRRRSRGEDGGGVRRAGARPNGTEANGRVSPSTRGQGESVGPTWAKPIAWAERWPRSSENSPDGDIAETHAVAVRGTGQHLVRGAGDAASLDRIVDYFRLRRQVQWDQPA